MPDQHSTNMIKETAKIIPHGFLVAFEGIDGSGKTSIARMVSSHLNDCGYNAVYLREPTDGPYGKQLRAIMVSGDARDPLSEFDLFLKDRKEDVEQNINPVLSAGGIVCIDRYYISSMAYQGALGLDPEMIRETNEKFAPVPDLILRFNVNIDEALKRIKSTRSDGPNQFEQRDYQEKVNRIFDSMQFSQMIEIDADQNLQDVFQSTISIIVPMLKSVEVTA